MYGPKLLLPFFVCLLYSGLSRAQNWQWVKTSASSSYESINAIAVDQTDLTTYGVGEVSGLGAYSQITTNYGNEDAFVIKYDYAGNVIWAFPIGGPSKDEATGVEVDQTTGNVYVTGYVRRAGTVNFTGAIAGAAGTISSGGGNNDAFVACYSKNGALIWYNLISGNNDDRGLDLAVSSNGVFVLGYYTGSASYGSVNTALINGSINYFVSAYNPANGTFLWGNEMGSTIDDFVFSGGATVHERRGCGITADNNGVYIASFLSIGLLLPTYSIYHEGSATPTTWTGILSIPHEKIMSTSFLNNGSLNWYTTYNNTSGTCSGVDITNDCDGVYVIGSLNNGSVSPGGTTISSSADNAFISKLNKSNGTELWIRQLTSSSANGDYFIGVQADGYGSVYAVGVMLGTNVGMESPPVHNETGASTRETIIVKYGTNGVFKNFERLPSPQGNGSWATDIATFGNTSIAIGGYYDESLTLGSLNAPANDDNGFVARKTLEPPFFYTSAGGTNSFCTSESNPLPTINVAGSGTFTGPPQVIFSNSTTGLINLSACTPGGPYTITYTIPLLGCKSFTGTYDIYINGPDNASFNFVTSIFCLGGTNPTPTVTTPGGTFTSTLGLVFANSSTGELDLTNSSIGNYTITYTTAGSPCVGTSTYSITIFAEEDPTFSYASASYCPTDANPTPTTALAGGTFTSTAGLIFVNSTTGEIDLAGSTPGTYTITYTTPGPNCANSTTTSLTITAQDDPSFSYAASTFCQGDANPVPSSITTPSGTFSAPAGIVFVSTSTGEIDLASSTPGTYSITYTTSGTCPANSAFSITVFAEEDPTFSYASASYCPTDANPTPTTALAGGTFTSTAGLIFVNATTGEIDLAGSTPGTYTITYTTPGPNCANSTTTSLTITAQDDPAFSYAASTFCQGDANPIPSSITSAGGTFSAPAGIIFVSTSTGEIDLASSTPGTYSITYTTSGTCPANSAFSITVFAEEDPTFSYASASYCPTDANPTPTTALAGGTFTSTAGLIFVNSTTGEIDLAGSTPGTYTITYTTPGPNCANSTTASLTITAQDDPSFSYAASTFCQGDANPVPSSITTPSGTFSAPAGIVFVSTSTGEIDLSGSTSATYSITYTTSGTCPANSTFSITIFEEEDPTFSYASASYCPTDANPTPTTALAGGTFTSTAGLIFVNSTTGEIDLAGSTPGTYTITYTTPGPNCANSTTASLTITAQDDPAFSYSASTFCQGDANPVPSSITTAGGTFSAPAGIIFVSTSTGEIDLLASTPGTYSITYTTSGTCPANSTFSITIFAEEDPTFSYASASYCPTDANPTPTTALAGGTFTSTAGLIFVNSTTGEIDLAGSTPGTYTITYTTPGPNCANSTTASLTITAQDDPSFSYAASTFCQGDANPVPSSITTPSGTFSAPAGIVFVSTSTGEIDLSGSTSATYSITYTTSGTCPANSTFSITIFEEEDPTFSYASASYCPTDANPTPTTALAGGTFTSTAGLIFVNSTTGEIDLAGSTPGTYTITYTTPGPNCANSATVSLTINPLDVVSLNYSSELYCELDEIQIPTYSPTGGVFTASSGLALISSSTGEFNPTLSTLELEHTITYTSNGACPNSKNATVKIFTSPSANAGEDQSLPFLFSTKMDAAAPIIGTSTWATTNNEIIIDDLTDANSVIKNLPPGDTEFTWEVSNGTCPIATDKVLITVEDLWIPQALTPNNDGDNDFFALKSVDDVTCQLQLFNRWGQIVYTSENYKNEWQGQNMNGDIQPNDTYFYVILIDGKFSYNGYVILKK